MICASIDRTVNSPLAENAVDPLKVLSIS